MRHQTEEKDLGTVKRGGTICTCPIRNAHCFATVCPKEHYPVEATARIPFLFIAPLNNPPPPPTPTLKPRGILFFFCVYIIGLQSYHNAFIILFTCTTFQHVRLNQTKSDEKCVLMKLFLLHKEWFNHINSVQQVKSFNDPVNY